MAEPFVSKQGDCDVHESGWVDLPGGGRITRLPVWDRSCTLAARLGHGPAHAMLRSRGLCLPTAAEYAQLNAMSLFVRRYFLPTAEMVTTAGVPKPWVTGAGADSPQLRAYRTSNMRSLEWCVLHDFEMWVRMGTAGWNGEPVSNFGKHWGVEVVNGVVVLTGWWDSVGVPLQRASRAHLNEPLYTDYATTFHAVEPGTARPRWQGDVDSLPLVLARNYTPAARGVGDIDNVVIHTMEAPEKPTMAEGVAQWIHGPDAPRVSFHVAVDCDSAVMCLPFRHVAWHAKGANRRTIGVEHAGYARQTSEEWADKFSSDMLGISASIVAQVCGRYQLPVAYVDAAGLRLRRKGITTHAAVTEAFGEGTHTDPGKGFPMAAYLDMVRAAPQFV